MEFSLPWSDGEVADGGVVPLAPHNGAIFVRRNGEAYVASDECAVDGGQVGEGGVEAGEALFGVYGAAAEVGDGAVDLLSSCVPPIIGEGTDADAVHVVYEQFPPCDGVEVARIIACTIGIFFQFYDGVLMKEVCPCVREVECIRLEVAFDFIGKFCLVGEGAVVAPDVDAEPCGVAVIHQKCGTREVYVAAAYDGICAFLVDDAVVLGDFAGVNLGQSFVVVDKMAVGVAVALPHGGGVVFDAVEFCAEHTVVDFTVLIQHGKETVFQWDCPRDSVAVFVFVVFDDAVLRPAARTRTVVVAGVDDVSFGEVGVALHFLYAVEPDGGVAAPLSPSCSAAASLCAKQSLFFDEVKDLELEGGEVIAAQDAAVVEFDEASCSGIAVDFDGVRTGGGVQQDDLCPLNAVFDVVGEFYAVNGDVDKFLGEVGKGDGVFPLPARVFDADFVFHGFSFYFLGKPLVPMTWSM